VSQKCTFLYLE